MTPAELRRWIEQRGLTQKGAAKALGRSRRQIVYYLSGRWPVPQVVALACRGIPLPRPKSDDA